MVWGISIAWSAGSSEVFEFHTILWGFLKLPKAVPQVDFFFSLIRTWPFHLAAILRQSSCPFLSDLSLAYWDPKMKGSLLGKWDFGSKSIHRIQSRRKDSEDRSLLLGFICVILLVPHLLVILDPKLQGKGFKFWPSKTKRNPSHSSRRHSNVDLAKGSLQLLLDIQF